jgi:hypothetical protein
LFSNIINNMKVKASIDAGLETTKSIMEQVIPNHNFGGDANQLQIGIHSQIANAMFARDKEVLELERLTTLIALARTLDDINIHKAYDALNYQIIKRAE